MRDRDDAQRSPVARARAARAALWAAPSLVKGARGRVRHAIARAALALPAAVQVRLAGGKPVVVDGLTLHPELQLMFALQRLVGAKRLTEGEAAACRRRVRREALEHAGPTVPVGAVRDFTIPGPAGAIPVRHYAPRSPAGAPLLVYLHGGGFVVGDLDTSDPLCRLLCAHGAMHVLSVDYRLAPEHPFPAAFDDARAAFLWARDHAASLGADAARVGVGGDSAGAHLAAVLSIDLVHERARAGTTSAAPPDAQLLIYPAIDRGQARPSLELFAQGFLLERTDIERFQQWYAGHLTAPELRAAPLLALETEVGLRDQPPAVVVTAGFDPLRDEGEEWARHLEAAGNTVVLRRFEDLTHGFTNLVGVSKACRDAVVEIAATTRAALERPRADTFERAAPARESS